MPIGRKSLLIVVVPLIAVSWVSVAAAEGKRDALSTLHKAHPRLLFTTADQERIEKLAKTDALLARLIKQNHANATGMLRQSRVRYEIPDGKRLLGQSRKCVQRVSSMAMAYRLTGETAFAEGAIGDMLTAAKFKDWNPRHFLDTAEMTTALALGYDWLYDVMKPSDRKTIREAIVRLGLNEGLECYKRNKWWAVGDNNWNQVCNGGMLLGALAVAEDEAELARRIIAFAVKSIPHGVSVYKPSGAYPEGPGYWQYGTAYTCLTISALNTALGHDFDIHKTPGLDRTGFYRIHTLGPTEMYFNYADSGMGSRRASAMFVFSKTYDQPAYAWWHRKRLADRIPAGRKSRPANLDRFFPLEIAWYDNRGVAPTDDELPPDALFKSRQDVVTMRSEWGNADAVYVGFKAGDNRTNHGHLDVGSFVLDADGVRWALDLGSDNYNMPGYFGRQRWQYYRMTNRSHNTLVIDDQLQNPRAKCSVIAFHSTPKRVSAIVDMTDAYKGQAKRVLRGVEMLDRRAVHVRDEITGTTGEVRWGMVTEAKIKLAGKLATLTQAGKTLQVEILEPAGSRFEIVSTKPPTAREKQNAGTSMLATKVRPEPDKQVAISILLEPISSSRSDSALRDQPLSEWPR